MTPEDRAANFNTAFNHLLGFTGKTVNRKAAPKSTVLGTMAGAKHGARAQTALKRSYDRVDQIMDDIKRIEALKNQRQGLDGSNYGNRPIDVESTYEAPNSATVSQPTQPKPEDNDFIKRLESYEDPREAQAALESLFKDNPFEGAVKNFGKDMIGRVGDLASRPLYAVNDMNLRFQKALDEGQNPLGTFDDMAYGAWRGLSGQSKTTPGDYVEYMSDPNVDRSNRGALGDILSKTGLQSVYEPFTRASMEAEEAFGENNFVSRNLNRTAGFIGETVLDPMNVVGGAKIATAGRQVSKPVRKAFNEAAQAGAIGSRQLEPVLREVSEKVVKDIKPLQGGTVGRNAIGRFKDGGPVHQLTKSMAEQADEAILTPQGQVISLNNGAVRNSIATRGALEAQDQLTSKFDDQVVRFLDGDISPGKYDDLAQHDPFWREVDEYLDQNYPNLKDTDPNFNSAIQEAAASARDAVVGKTVREVQQNIEKQLDGLMYNTFALRVGNKKIPVHFMGKAYAAAKSKVGFKAPSPLSYNSQFAGGGRAGQAISNARRAGHRNFENFTSRTRPVARQYDSVGRQDISNFIDRLVRKFDADGNKYWLPKEDDIVDGMRWADHPLHDGVEHVYRENADILQLEKAAGVRGIDDVAAGNYQYLYFKERVGRGAKRAREFQEKIKAKRAEEVKTTGRIHTTFDEVERLAKEAGVRVNVVKDPFEALARRRLKAERLMNRSYVTEQFFRNYGLSSSKMGKDTIDELGLKAIYSPTDGAKGSYRINQTIKNYADNADETLYLPKDIAEAYDNYLRLADNASIEELEDYLRLYDRALNFFKINATLPFPGFHVKNMAGDIFLGFMDGVMPWHYTRVNRAMRSKSRIGSKATYKFDNGIEIPVNDFEDLFKTYGSGGGFTEADLFEPTNIPGAGLRAKPRQAGQKMRGWSEMREDYGRRVHFYHALNEELKRKGIKNFNADVAQSKAFQDAINNATWRLDKYKFDYGALTATERQYMRRVIPFYTFLRKSTPLMLEGLLMNPALYGKTYRFFDDENNIASRAAQWQRELGFAALGGEDSPILIPSNVLPFDSLTTWGKDPFNAGVMAENFANSMSPMLKAIPELATGDSLFTGQQLFEEKNPSTLEAGNYFLQNMFAPARAGNQLREQVTEGEFDPAEFLSGSRFALGMGGRRLTREQQQRNLQSDLGYYKGELAKMSESLKPYGIKIFVSERSSGVSVKVRTLDGKKTIYDGDVQGAIAAAEDYVKNPGNKITKDQEIVEYVNKDGDVKKAPRSTAEHLGRILTP